MNTKAGFLQDAVEILIVEDSLTQAEQLKYFLEQAGYRVMAAENGNQALVLLRECLPTLIITDIIMPEMDGYELCKRIKQDERSQEIPVILLTSLTSAEDVLEGLACGADNFITKPYSEEYLLSSIEKILAGKKLRKNERVRIGVEIMFAGKTRFITADQQQMLSLLISTYEAAVHRNSELVKAQDELRELNERLEDLVELRTAALSAEIVERKQAEEALRESEELYRSLFQNHAAVKLIIDPNTGNIIDLNAAAASFYGWSREKLKQMNIQDINTLSPDEVKEQMEKVRAEKRIHFEFRHRRADGSIRDVEVFSSKIKSKGKDFLHSIIHDITDRKRAEEALALSEARFRRLAENAQDLVYRYELTPRPGFTYINPAAAAVTGYTPEEFYADPQLRYKVVHPADRNLFEAAIMGRLPSNQLLSLRWVRKDGTLIWIELCRVPVYDKEGNLVAVEGIARDITERKRAEEEKAKLQGQLFQAQKLESVGMLTGGIAHDFNNLLTPIIGNAEMALSDMSREEPLYEIMEEIRNAGARAASLTRQLLAFSRKQILQPEVLDINGAVRETDKMLRRIIGEDIELKTILSPDLGRVEADVGQIEQVLMNLVVNARDAMPTGGKLTIETKNVELDETYARDHVSVIPGPYVMLAVSDTGAGMDKETRSHVFEPFFTTKDKGKGTGLGLSTVYGIVKQSRGNIWMYSEPGQGTTFKIYLPRVEETAEVMEEAEKKEASLQGSETILVVEDDEMVRNMTIKILQKYGYTVLCAGDGQEALEMCGEHKERIQLILTDVVMPGMSGKDLTQELQRIRPGIKVIFMSGYTDNSIVHHGILERGIAFLQKPFTPEGLARKVREVMGRNKE